MTRQLRVLLVIDNLGSGGAQRQLVNLALGLQARGHHAEVFCYTPGNFFSTQLEAARIPVHIYAKSKRTLLGVVWNLRQLIRRGRFDATIAFLDGPNTYLLLATLGLRTRPKVIVSERFYDPPEGVGWRQKVPRFLYRFADHITTNSHHQRETLERKLPHIVGRTSTIYNGVDLTIFHPREKALPASPLRLLAIASISPYKNGLCLIQALDILNKVHALRPCVSWVGVHSMVGERGNYIALMQRAITEFHLEDQWEWLYERNDIPKLMSSFHALVHPSYGEGLPNVVCEALSSGLPVIISDTLDHPKLVEHDVSGYLFDWRDPQDLARWIKAMHDLPCEERTSMGLKGRAFAEEHLALSVFVEQYERLFLSLTGTQNSEAQVS
jgi:glycosyltransferase involved in cell wall biosynthesis